LPFKSILYLKEIGLVRVHIHFKLHTNKPSNPVRCSDLCLFHKGHLDLKRYWICFRPKCFIIGSQKWVADLFWQNFARL